MLQNETIDSIAVHLPCTWSCCSWQQCVHLHQTWLQDLLVKVKKCTKKYKDNKNGPDNLSELSNCWVLHEKYCSFKKTLSLSEI